MGAKTLIQWCAYYLPDGRLVPGYTFNPWIGCAHADLDGAEDPACANCYAEVGTMARVHQHRGLPIWGLEADRHRTSADYWKNPRRWNELARAAGVRPRVFCASLADVLEDRRDLDPWRRELWPLIEDCDQLDWLLLTKRPGAAPRLVPPDWMRHWPEHVWFGFSAGTQRALEVRAPQALRVPARIRFVSLEPLLEAVDLDLARCDTHGRGAIAVDSDGEYCKECAASDYSGELSYGHWLDACADEGQPGFNWIIVGGESGKKARPCELDAIRGVVKQCRDAEVPVFVKQLGAAASDPVNGIAGAKLVVPDAAAALVSRRLRHEKGGDMNEWPEDLRVRQWPEGRDR